MSTICAMFCDEIETIDHLFVQSPYVNCLWQWISKHNNFQFNVSTLDDLWCLNALISFKEVYLTELCYGAMYSMDHLRTIDRFFILKV
jgi:hypothetical protein